MITLQCTLQVGLAIVAMSFAPNAGAAVTVFENRAAWEAVAGHYSTITFTELPENTWITDQYAHLGVTFTDGSDQIRFNPNTFSDNYGLNGAFDETTLEFDSPRTTLAMDFPGLVNIRLYSGGELFYTGPIFGGSGSGHFAGLVSTQPFDRAFIYDPSGDLFVDNLYFGPPIPGPGTLAMLAFSVVMMRCRGRRAD